ncbi:RagB/SusD family nutrient uptake outer membrane protein [Tenacibaculum tangerinum]|uniref:RagB/SusD family nutrient uptake outer membrane protein n=1 Tax=Tenacibaculum tangerinum TaxID=3038772 RepID=A0ABY8L3T6_9FLAO|nr:RagB/SusD family nutrient uptake outer membrane protein [Tenacibaculum tangerinum]WGH76089.1 RagB/SusD family nutrient uptake outer membrane protein [Tenacibaculum tangerinum]
MKKYLIFTISTFFIFSCTDLDKELDGLLDKSGLTKQEIVTGQLVNAYSQLRSFQHQEFQYVLQQHPTDEMAGPTRGADWDDGGAWRALHLHQWNSSHPRISGAWDQILGGLFSAIDALNNEPNDEERAMATFYSSFYIFTATDLWGQVPNREIGTSYGDFPTVLKRTEAIDIAISQLEAVYDNLPSGSASNSVNKYVAATLLAKMYLNRAVYKATDEDGTPQTGPFAFDNADMQKVVDYCDTVLSGPFSLQANYFDAFAPNNTDIGTEIIFASENDNKTGGELARFYFMTLHYNNNPGGWNGFVALTDLYDKFDDSDPRIGGDYDGLTDVSGLKTGFLVGQQYDEAGNEIEDRAGQPLAFTKEFSLANSTEEKGMRVIKYMPDYANLNRPANDFVIFRLADVYLMKAEAMTRMGGDASGPLNVLRTARGVESVYTGATLDDILDERARELYWEGWRRQDQIRFSTFLDPVQEKPESTDRTKIIYPIPAKALSTNPNLTQNPGY